MLESRDYEALTVVLRHVRDTQHTNFEGRDGRGHRLEIEHQLSAF